MVSEALGAIGFRTLGREVREFRDKQWTRSGHDLDRLYERDGVVYGSEIKNTLKYIPQAEFQTKLWMCQVLGVRPLFVGRMMPKNYIRDVWRAGGYSLVFGKQMYPFGNVELMERVRERLELPVASPIAIEAGLMKRFEDWHRGHGGA